MSGFKFDADDVIVYANHDTYHIENPLGSQTNAQLHISPKIAFIQLVAKAKLASAGSPEV